MDGVQRGPKNKRMPLLSLNRNSRSAIRFFHQMAKKHYKIINWY